MASNAEARTVPPTRNAIRPHEAAFVLRCSEREVRNRLRRGERYAEAGNTAADIVQRGALVSTRVGGRRLVELTSIAACLESDGLALAVLDAIVERRLRAPRSASPAQIAPDLLTVVSYL